MMASDPSGRASCMELLEFAWFQESLICSITDAQQVRTYYCTPYALLFTVRATVHCTHDCSLHLSLLSFDFNVVQCSVVLCSVV